MAQHGIMVKLFKGRVSSSLEKEKLEEERKDISSLLKEKAIDKNNPADKKFLLNMQVHACDIGNPTLAYRHYFTWAALIC